MDNTIRVYNDRKYHVGLVLQNGNARVVHSGSFVSLSRDEIEYVASIAPALFEGEHHLRLEDRLLATELGFVERADQPLFDEVEIKKGLLLKQAAMVKWLEGIQEPQLLDLVYEVAMTMDLPASKLVALKEKLPAKEFIGSEE